MLFRSIAKFLNRSNQAKFPNMSKIKKTTHTGHFPKECPYWSNSEIASLAKFRKNVHIGQIEQCIDMNNSYVIQISVPAHHESVDVGAR